MILEINEEEKQLILDALGTAEGEVVGLARWAILGPKIEALEAKIRAVHGGTVHGGTEKDYEDIYQ